METSRVFYVLIVGGPGGMGGGIMGTEQLGDAANSEFTGHALGACFHLLQQLSEVEQASLANVNRLVLECEDTLEREREAWLSTSMATKALVKAAASGLQGDPKSGEKDGAGAAGGAESEPTSKPMLSYV